MYLSKTVLHFGVDLIFLTYCICLLKLFTKIGVEFLAFCDESLIWDLTLIGFYLHC